METIQTLGTALGLSALAGIDLYITVFFSGLAIRLGWVHLAPGLQGLNALADPAVLTVAGIMLVIEFVIDKCPYADSAWDSLHTIVRPIGGAIIALKALGSLDPSVEIIGVLLAGSVTLTTHATKAGTRLIANTSPEPFSNMALSVGEDVTVLGGLYVVYAHPVISLFLVVIFVAAFWYLFPKFFRMGRAHVTAIIHRFSAKRQAALAAENKLPAIVPPFAVETWLTLQKGNERLAWVLPCFTGQWKYLGRFVRGCLLATSDGRVFFIGKKNFRMRIREIPMAGARVELERRRLYHRLIIQTSDGEIVRLRFTHRYAPCLPEMQRWLEPQLHAVEIMPGPAPVPAHSGAGI